MLKALQLEPEKCTGCLQCEMACSYENEGIFNPSKSRIKVFTFHEEGRFAPYTCTQCAEAWCLHACPVEAIVINPVTGSKDVLEDVCVGCKVCTIACPFGTVNYNADTGKVIKCDLCGLHAHLRVRPRRSLMSTLTIQVSTECAPTRRKQFHVIKLRRLSHGMD